MDDVVEAEEPPALTTRVAAPVEEDIAEDWAPVEVTAKELEERTPEVEIVAAVSTPSISTLPLSWLPYICLAE